MMDKCQPTRPEFNVQLKILIQRDPQHVTRPTQLQMLAPCALRIHRDATCSPANTGCHANMTGTDDESHLIRSHPLRAARLKPRICFDGKENALSGTVRRSSCVSRNNSRSHSREQQLRFGETVAVATGRTCLEFMLPILDPCISTVADRLGRLMLLWRCISTGARLAAVSVPCRADGLWAEVSGRLCEIAPSLWIINQRGGSSFSNGSAERYLQQCY